MKSATILIWCALFTAMACGEAAKAPTTNDATNAAADGAAGDAGVADAGSDGTEKDSVQADIGADAAADAENDAQPDTAADQVADAPAKNPYDLGFLPSKDGLPLANWATAAADDALTAVEVRRLGGDAVCAQLPTVPTDPCTLSPVADAWRKALIGDLDGGRCDGLGLLALRQFTQAQDLSPLKPLQADHAAFAREVALWAATQAVDGVAQAATAGEKPVTILQNLKDLLQNQQPATLSMWKPGWRGGHSVVPFAVTEQGSVASVRVYDSNFPSDDGRLLTINTTTGAWSYAAAAASVPNATYSGDEKTGNLALVPLSSRTLGTTCLVCGKVGPTPQVTWSLRGGGDLLIQDKSGQLLGYQAGAWVHKWSAATVRPRVSANLWQDNPQPWYTTPTGQMMSATIDGKPLIKLSKQAIFALTPGLAWSVEEIDLPSADQDLAELSADTRTWTYTTLRTESVVARLALTTADAMWELAVTTATESGGQILSLRLDLTGGFLEMQGDAIDGHCDFAVTVRRVTPGGIATLQHNGVSLLAADALRVQFAAWSPGQPLQAQLDKGKDGQVDSSEFWDNQP